jgi:hypothetical protein
LNGNSWKGLTKQGKLAYVTAVKSILSWVVGKDDRDYEDYYAPDDLAVERAVSLIEVVYRQPENELVPVKMALAAAVMLNRSNYAEAVERLNEWKRGI